MRQPRRGTGRERVRREKMRDRERKASREKERESWSGKQGEEARSGWKKGGCVRGGAHPIHILLTFRFHLSALGLRHRDTQVDI